MKLTRAQMELFTLGAALVGSHPDAARIVARALDESTRMQRRANTKTQTKAKKKKGPR